MLLIGCKEVEPITIKLISKLDWFVKVSIRVLGINLCLQVWGEGIQIENNLVGFSINSHNSQKSMGWQSASFAIFNKEYG